MPDAAMSPKAVRIEEQLQKLRQRQSRADHRIKLGRQMVKAAEAFAAEQQQQLRHVADQQQDIREQLHHDVAKTLQSYDQWLGKLDEGFTSAMHRLEQRMEAMETRWQNDQVRMETLLSRSEQMVRQARELLDADEQPPSLRLVGSGNDVAAAHDGDGGQAA
jgi:hypothetical protein